MSPEDAEKAAGEYAWEHFKLHALQRQAVFRFYLLLLGAVIVGYGYSFKNPNAGWLYGSAIIVFSFLFWRADQRSRKLIKLGERALFGIEKRLSAHLNSDIELMRLAEEKLDPTKHPFLYRFESFSQIYQSIFLLLGCAGVVILLATAARDLWN